jgi:hypothetical protein
MTADIGRAAGELVAAWERKEKLADLAIELQRLQDMAWQLHLPKTANALNKAMNLAGYEFLEHVKKLSAVRARLQERSDG